MSARLSEQYEEIADAIEMEGLGYALTDGYIKPNTNDERLNGAITKAIEGMCVIEEIVGPYRR